MSEKTEQPTGKRINEARQEGQVARSQELNTAVAILLSAWLLAGPGRRLLTDLQTLTISSISALPTLEFNETWINGFFARDGLRIGMDVGIIAVSLMVVSVSITLLQTKFLFASKNLKIDLKRLNPLNGFKRMFSSKGLMEFVKATLKLLVVGWVGYVFLRARISSLMGLAQTDLNSALQWWAGLAVSLIYRIGAAYLVLAILDYAYIRWQYKRGMLMTKEEVKEEMKQQEGDPVIKGRIRGAQRRMARLRMMANVHKADVVITNPTHLAVAIQYEQQAMAAPRVLAKGAYLVAERIVKLAQANDIPVIQNIPLAQAIYRSVGIDQEIPPALYLAMAEVLAHIYKLRGKTPQYAAAQ